MNSGNGAVSRDTIMRMLMTLLLSVAVAVRDSPSLKLMACIVVDMIGAMTYLIPFVGELADLGWAPIQAMFLHFMFHSPLITAVGFLEDMGPGTDIIPTACIAWALENVESLQQFRQFLFTGSRRATDHHRD